MLTPVLAESAGHYVHVDANRKVLIRDCLPASWDIIAGDERTVRTVGDRKRIEFAAPVESGTRTYFAEAPDGTGTYRFGSAEYSADSGRTWQKLNGVTEENAVAGADTNV